MRDLEGLSLGGVLEKGAVSFPNKTAVICGPLKKTYKELNESADILASGLWARGFIKGDRIAIYMKSSIEFITAFYALEKLGIIVVWINSLYRNLEAHYILHNSGAKGVFIFRQWGGYDYLEALSLVRSSLPDLESIFVVGEGQGEGVHEWKDLMAQGSAKSYPRPLIAPQDDLSMLIYTSGTTGKPKGAMITHYQAVRAGWEYSKGVEARADDVFIGVLPMSHSYGCGALLIQPLLLQATLVLMETFNPDEALKLIEKEKVTLQLAAPVHYLLELNSPFLKKCNLSSLRAGLIAGQPAPEGLITRVEKEMGIYLTSFWGASEVGPGLGILCPYPSPLEIRERYIGKPIDDTQVRVVDPETRRTLADGEIGELTLSGWHVLKGYWNNPEETGKQIEAGWLFMGDLVSREKDGYFRVYGRLKDLINRGGYKIYPYELEAILVAYPKVDQVCVVPIPNPVLGETIGVCIIPVRGQTVTLDELREFMKGKVAPHKLPEVLCVMDDFPRLSGGVKIKKFGEGGLTEIALKSDRCEVYRKAG